MSAGLMVLSEHKRPALVLALIALVGFALWTQVDLDGDGLTTQREWALGTDSIQADSDSDTVDDGWEVLHGLSPIRPDTDGDALNDRSELISGTNPLSQDSDNDAVPDARELLIGTNARDSDTDRDRLDDGLELTLGTNLKQADTEGDGLGDADEVLNGGNPHASDTDLDGVPDVGEGVADCNGNHIKSIADADDDSDQRTDGKEVADERCAGDFDGDTVLDGLERSVACVRVTDCDRDGVPDGVEQAIQYNPLSSDTYGTGLNDAIALAFHHRNQPPSRDEDRDGIPDAWESTDGLIKWGTLTPKAGRKDLLIEFVRVQGPQSGRFAYLDFTPSYRAVAQVFSDAGINAQWIETIVTLRAEDRPSLIPSSYAPFYEDILARAQFSTNPYVTTVVMNPQHDQSMLAHTGVAPIRGLLAAIDYGRHVDVYFGYTYIDSYRWTGKAYVPVYKTGTVTFSPYLESLVVGNRQDILQDEYGFLGGGLDARGQLYLLGTTFTLYWTPFWFAGHPYLVGSSGEYLELVEGIARVDTHELSRTILHELGHTLGLCHAHETDCSASFNRRDQFRADESTMSYNSQGLLFLDSEWSTVKAYVACPPHDALADVARNAPASQVIEVKYGYLLSEILNVQERKCGETVVIPADLSPDGEPLRFAATYTAVTDSKLTQTPNVFVLAWPAPQSTVNSPVASIIFALGAIAIAAAGAYGANDYVKPDSRLRRLLRPESAQAAVGPTLQIVQPAAGDAREGLATPGEAFALLDQAGEGSLTEVMPATALPLEAPQAADRPEPRGPGG